MKQNKKANDFYDNIILLTYECNCTGVSQWKWDELMKNAKKANFYKVNKLVRELLPDLAESLGLFDKSLKNLSWYNPYSYYRTETHLVLVHSSIEYFLKIN